MKKKIALLLALTMVLSLIPMNVFGFSVTPQGHFVFPWNVHTELGDAGFRKTLALRPENFPADRWWTARVSFNDGMNWAGDAIFTTSAGFVAVLVRNADPYRTPPADPDATVFNAANATDLSVFGGSYVSHLLGLADKTAGRNTDYRHAFLHVYRTQDAELDTTVHLPINMQAVTGETRNITRSNTIEPDAGRSDFFNSEVRLSFENRSLGAGNPFAGVGPIVLGTWPTGTSRLNVRSEGLIRTFDQELKTMETDFRIELFEPLMDTIDTGVWGPVNKGTESTPVWVNEWTAGDIYEIRLELPRGFSWGRPSDTVIYTNNTSNRGVQITDAYNFAGRFGNEFLGTAGGANINDLVSDNERADGKWGVAGAFQHQRVNNNNTNTHVLVGAFQFRNGSAVTNDNPRTTVRLLETIEIAGLTVDASDTNFTGDVYVNVSITRFETYSEGHQTRRNEQHPTFADAGSARVRIGVREREGFIFEIVDRADLDEAVLISGFREWDVAAGLPDDASDPSSHNNPTTIESAEIDNVSLDRPRSTINRGAVIDPDYDYHATAWVRLAEIIPDTFNFTGTNDISFTFGEGVRVLGVELNNDRDYLDAEHRYLADTNNGDHNLEFFHRGLTTTNDRQERIMNRNPDSDNTSGQGITYGVLVHDQHISIRPDFEGQDFVGSNDKPMSIRARFLISVEPGYEQTYGSEVQVTVSGGRAFGGHFEKTLTVAYVVDPVEVHADPVIIDDAGEVAFGRIRGESVNDVRVVELIPEALKADSRLYLDMARRFERGTTTTEDYFIDGTHAFLDNPDRTSMRISPLRRDNSGIYVEITNQSNEDDAEAPVIVFAGLTVSGVVIPGNDYSVTVRSAESISGNYNDNAAHPGFFSENPYSAHLFHYGGSDRGNNPDIESHIPGTNVTTPDPTPPPVARPVVNSTTPYRLPDGSSIWPAFSVDLPGNVGVGMLAVRVVIEELGLQFSWEPDTATAVLSHPPTGGVVRMTEGRQTALHNGVEHRIYASDGIPGRPVTHDGRLYVPLAFFREIGWCTIDYSLQGNVHTVVINSLH